MQIAIAIVTACIAFIVAVISWQQWKVNREKFRLDLYDRRFEIYVAVINYYRELLDLIGRGIDSVNRESLKQIQNDFIRSHQGSRFLYSSEPSIQLILKEFRERTNEILYYRDPKHKEEFSRMNETEKQKYAERDTDNINWIYDAILRFERQIAPYLRFHGYKEQKHWYQFGR